MSNGNQNEQGNESDQGGNNNQGNQGTPNHDIKDKIVCHAEVYEDIAVKVPVEFSTSADVGNILFECGASHIENEHKATKHTHKFEFVQKLSAKIPINVNAAVKVDGESVDFAVRKCE